MQRKTSAWIGLGAAALLALTGCSSKASDSGGGGSGSGDLKTDFGVTDSDITLGILTDNSNVFKAVGLNLTQGNEIWAKHINEQGGICDRQIKLNIQDTAYKPDNAIPMFDQMKGNVAGFMQILGSPIIAALKGKIQSDNVLAVIATQSSINLDAQQLMMIGNTYDVEMINGLAWAQKQGLLKDGDKIAHIYVDSEYGQNGLMGAQFYAKQHNLQVMEVPVSASDTDMTATMTKIKQEGAKLISLTVAPSATASVALQNVVQDLNVPLIGNDPVFATAMLADPSVTAALANLHIASGGEPFVGTSELNKQIQEDFNADYPGEAPGYGVPAGYLEALLWEAVLTKACENGDMTRQGLLDARLSLDDVDAKGLSGNMDLTDPGRGPTLESFIFKINKDIPGGHEIADGPFVSDEAKEYKAPHQK